MADDYVSIGTSLPTVNDDEFIPKPVRYQEMVAKDEKGRRRFHGAFTGGFSAGYFNSVGTREGWAPSHFISSRNKRGEVPEARPENYMDEEDFGEHGIAPRKLQVTKKFDPKKRKLDEHTSKMASVIQDLIIPAQSSMGARLLQKLGWREGQGIGPRIRKKKNKKKLYGCSLNPQSDSDDDYPSNITFAPKDIPPIKLTPKDDVKGLGYKAVEKTDRFELFPVAKDGDNRSKKGMVGSAFGVGALEEDDDQPVYDFDTLDNYNTQIGSDNEDENDLHIPLLKRDEPAPIDYIGIMLEGFSLSTLKEKNDKVYAPPEIPKGYKPRQSILQVKQETVNKNEDKLSEKKIDDNKKAPTLNAHSRGHILGEKPEIKSVFDIIPERDKVKLNKAIEKVKNQTEESTEKKSRFDVKALSNRFVSSTDKEDSEEIKKESSFDTSSLANTETSEVKERGEKLTADNEIKMKVGIASVSEQRSFSIPLCSVNSFKPFSKDPEKQERYERFQKSISDGIPYSLPSNCRLTEWEIQREKEEFARANRLYTPMSKMMSSRFTTAQYGDDEQNVKLPETSEQTDEEKAVQMKLFGRFTRKTLEWHPDKLLCKRFNVPNPYPESDVIGLPNMKRDKYSVFNLLTYQNEDSFPKPKAEYVESSEPKKDGNLEEEIEEKPKLLPLTFAVDVFERDKERRAREKEIEINKNLKLEDSRRDNVPTQMEMDKEEDEEETIEAFPPRPPMDLFASIFGDDDKEDDEEDENEIMNSVDKVMKTFDSPVIKEEIPLIRNEIEVKGDRTIMMEKSTFSKFLTNSNTKELKKETKEYTVVYEGPERPPPLAKHSHVYKSPKNSCDDNEQDRRKHKKKKDKKHKHSKKKKHKQKD